MANELTGRSGQKRKQAGDPAVERLLAALPDLEDYGTAWANKAAGVTLPKPARDTLDLPIETHWRVMGSPGLGIAILVGPRRNATDSLRFLLEGDESSVEAP